MKKKAVAISLIVSLLMVLAIRAAADEGFKSFFHLYKEVSSQGENYGITIKLSGNILEKVDAVSIKVPNHKKSLITNWLRFNNVLFSAEDMTYGQFARRFPEGEYAITLYQYGRYIGTYIASRNHDFPDVTVTYPEEGAVDVPTQPTIQWTPVTNANELTLRVETEWGGYDIGLDPESTSYTPYWTLDANSPYTLSLEAVSTARGNRTVTTHKVSFTTGE